jgi:hypothetical protein
MGAEARSAEATIAPGSRLVEVGDSRFPVNPGRTDVLSGFLKLCLYSREMDCLGEAGRR